MLFCSQGRTRHKIPMRLGRPTERRETYPLVSFNSREHKGNAMSKLKLDDIKVPFKYSRLERAAAFIGCEVSDLINLGANGSIAVCVMLNQAHGVVLADISANKATEWYLNNKERGNNANPFATKITEYSYFHFDNFDIDDDGDLKFHPAFVNAEGREDLCTGYGRAFGLWRLSYSLGEIERHGSSIVDYADFSPCMPSNNLPIRQYIVTDDRDGEFECKRTTVTADDLWITDIDVKRLIFADKDYSSLGSTSVITIMDAKMNMKDNIHHSTERHAGNREQVLMAAMRLREQQKNVFEENCRKPNGEINFSAWARELINRPDFFINQNPPIKTETKIAEILSNAHKSPSERKT